MLQGAGTCVPAQTCPGPWCRLGSGETSQGGNCSDTNAEGKKCLFMCPVVFVSFWVWGALQPAGTTAHCRERGGCWCLLGGSRRTRSPSTAAGTQGSLLGLLERKKVGGCVGAPTSRPSALPIGPRLCWLLQRPALLCLRNLGWLPRRETSASLLALALSRGDMLELLGTLWHRARMRLSLLYMSPSAFRTRFCDLPIHYVKPSKTRHRFQPGNSVTRVFPPCFLRSGGVVLVRL